MLHDLDADRVGIAPGSATVGAHLHQAAGRRRRRDRSTDALDLDVLSGGDAGLPFEQLLGRSALAAERQGRQEREIAGGHERDGRAENGDGE